MHLFLDTIGLDSTLEQQDALVAYLEDLTRQNPRARNRSIVSYDAFIEWLDSVEVMQLTCRLAETLSSESLLQIRREMRRIDKRDCGMITREGFFFFKLYFIRKKSLDFFFKSKIYVLILF